MTATRAPTDGPAPEDRRDAEPAPATARNDIDEFDGFDEEDAAWIEAASRAGGQRIVHETPWSDAAWIAAVSGAIDLHDLTSPTDPSPGSTPSEDLDEHGLADSGTEDDLLDDVDDERSDEVEGLEHEPRPAIAPAASAESRETVEPSPAGPPEADTPPHLLRDLAPAPIPTWPAAPPTTVRDAPSMQLQQQAAPEARSDGRSGSGRDRVAGYPYRSRRFDPSRGRVARVVAAVVVLVVLGVGTAGIGYALMRKSSTEAAAARSAATRYTPPAPTVGAAQPLMVVIGASGLVAAPASDPQAEQWPAQLADGIGTRAQDVDVSSSDLAAASNADAAALAGQVPSNAAVVVVVAGSSGGSKPQSGIGRVLTAVRTRAPQARIALVGPTAQSDEVASTARRDALAKAARAVDATWIDPIEAGWFPTPVETTSAGVSFAVTTAVTRLKAAVGPLVSASSSAPTSGS